MRPPVDTEAFAADASPAVSVCSPAGRMETLRNRPDFLRAASARKQGTQSLMLQARARGDDSAMVRVGYTASKKIGNAVARNRAKRRMRALAREVLAGLAQPGWDYVLVARPDATVSRAYADMMRDLETAIRSVHRARG